MARIAALLLAITGALHVLSPLVGGFAPEALFLVPIGLVWLVMAYGLNREWRWMAWLAFYATMVGAITAMSSALGYSAVPSWLYWVIAGLHAFVGVLLFGALWISKKRVTA